MKPIYRAGCTFKDNAAVEDFEKSATLCLEWATQRPGVEAPPEAARALDTLPRDPIGETMYLETLRVDVDESKNWALSLEHPDADDDRLWWRTEVAIARSREGVLAFSCVNLVGNRDGAVTPVRRPPSRPRIVETLMSLWPGDGIHQLSSRPVELQDTASSIGQFLEFLYSKDRQHPIVLASAKNIDDRPAVDVARIASVLSGLAHTYAASSRFPSLKLKDRLPKYLNCYDGAVRIYWPGFRAHDPPERHRVWSPRLIREIEAPPYRRPFDRFLLERVAGFASFNVRNDLPSWEQIQRLNRRLLLNRATQQNEFEEIANRYAEDNDHLELQLTQAREQSRQLAQDLDTAKNERDTWRQLYEASQRNVEVDPEVTAPVTTVNEAIERAKDQYEEEMAFALNNRSEVDTPFNAPDEVFSALAFLATTYRDAKIGRSPCADLDHALRTEIAAWRYKGGQSQLTMTSQEGWYRCSHEGNKYWLGEHVGTGSNRDARFTIRIAFAWDSDLKKVIVGFIGQHQKDSNT